MWWHTTNKKSLNPKITLVVCCPVGGFFCLATRIFVVRCQAAARVRFHPLPFTAGQHSCVCCWSCFWWAKVSKLRPSLCDLPKSCHLPNNEDQRPLIKTTLVSLPVVLAPKGRWVNAPLRGRSRLEGGDQSPHSSAVAFLRTETRMWLIGNRGPPRRRTRSRTRSGTPPPTSPPPPSLITAVNQLSEVD